MSIDPNTVTIFSPEGERFETSRANARDLHNHRGWTYDAPDGVIAPEPEAEEEAEDAADEGSVEDGEDEGSEDAADEGDSEEADEGSEEADEGSLRLTEEDFADLTTKEAVLDYLAAEFPDFKPHHLAQRESLIKKAIELAKA